MNKKELNKLDFKVSLIFMIIACVGGIFTSLYMLPTIPLEQMNGLTKTQFIIIITLQVTIIYGLFLSFVGLKLARATNFKKAL